VSQTLHSTRVAISNDGEQTINPTVGDGLSKLNYVDINIHGIQGTQTALHDCTDCGSEINLINREFVEQLSNLPSMGRIKIKGVIGPAVETALTILDISPAAMDADTINIAPPLREHFAVVLSS